MSLLTDPRVTRTRDALVRAMGDLLDEYEPGDLSITEVVARAGVSRPSFYQHAGNIPALVVAAGVDRLATIFARSDARTAGHEGEELARLTVSNIVTSLDAERQFYRRVLRGVSSHDVSAQVTAFVATRMRGRLVPDSHDPRLDDRVTVIAAGATWLIVRWLGDEHPDPPARMSERLLDAILTLSSAATS